jgi:hypothetical protein
MFINKGELWKWADLQASWKSELAYWVRRKGGFWNTVFVCVCVCVCVCVGGGGLNRSWSLWNKHSNLKVMGTLQKFWNTNDFINISKKDIHTVSFLYYGLDDRANEVRSPPDLKGYFL